MATSHPTCAGTDDYGVCFDRDLSATLILSDPAVWGNSEPSQSSLYSRDLMLVLWDSIGNKV